MTSLTYFVQEKRKVQEAVNDIVEQLNSMKKVNIEDAESVQTLIEDITYASKRLEEEQAKFRALVFEHYSAPAPDEEADPEDVEAYEDEEQFEQPQPEQQEQVIDHQAAQTALMQNIVTAVTAAIGAYGIFKNLKK